MFFKALRNLIPLKGQVVVPWELVARDQMFDEEEGDGFVGLHADTPVFGPAFPSLGLGSVFAHSPHSTGWNTFPLSTTAPYSRPGVIISCCLEGL